MWRRYHPDDVLCMPASASVERGAIAEDKAEEEGGEENEEGPEETDAAMSPVLRTPRRIGSLGGDESDCSSDGSVSEDEGFS